MLSWSLFLLTPQYGDRSQKNVLEYQEESISELLLSQGSFHSVCIFYLVNSWENSHTFWTGQPTDVGTLICKVLHGGSLLRRPDKAETSTVTLA